MTKIDYAQLTTYAKAFTGFTPEKEALLQQAGMAIKPGLPEVTQRFYKVLQSIERTSPYIDGRLEHLMKTHLAWLEGLFTGPYDASYTEAMYQVGKVHVKADLPVEFMSGGMSLITEELIELTDRTFAGDPRTSHQMLKAINAVMGFSLLIMQQSFQNNSLDAELERFLAITGMSRTLFENLASAYKS